MTSIRLSDSQSIDLSRLLETRLLIQANSGGGKSWCIRRILEQSHGKVQQLVIDPEGEFSSLREKYDYVLAARHGGDTAVDPRIAKLLAERLLDLGVSAILDIYELKASERVRFVRYFLEALVDAPKNLWHPALVILDEAHIYCPQQGEAESATAVIDLATRGRKRGFALIPATQRLAKLHKDVAAECNNKLIGRTGLDVDVKRASDELGFSKERWPDLRRLKAGHFFAFGPAISTEVVEVHVGAVHTTHPEAGRRLAIAPPAPTSKIKALLPKLADLPAEAQERQKNTDDLKREIQSLRGQLTAAQRAKPAPEVKEVLVVKHEQITAIKAAIEPLVSALGRLNGHAAGPKPASIPPPKGVQAHPARVRADLHDDDLPALRKGARRMLDALAQRHPAPTTRSQLGALSFMRPTSGTFGSYLGDLRRGGFMREQGDALLATELGLAHAGVNGSVPQTPEEIRAMWRSKFRAGARRMFDHLVSIYPERVTRQELGEACDIESTSGTFGSYLGDLRRSNLIVDDRETVGASEELF